MESFLVAVRVYLARLSIRRHCVGFVLRVLIFQYATTRMHFTYKITPLACVCVCVHETQWKQ